MCFLQINTLQIIHLIYQHKIQRSKKKSQHTPELVHFWIHFANVKLNCYRIRRKTGMRGMPLANGIDVLF